ncbi:MAG: hypothetical protein JWQ95_5320 [Sphaerisporangium sp.]|nr:hypothetical protein [Sphaerisporangium sp.]
MANEHHKDGPAVDDEATWRSGLITSGKVKMKITERTEDAGRTVNASPDDPQFLLDSDKSGKSALHRPSSLQPKD